MRDNKMGNPTDNKNEQPAELYRTFTIRRNLNEYIRKLCMNKVPIFRPLNTSYKLTACRAKRYFPNNCYKIIVHLFHCGNVVKLQAVQ